MSNPSVQQELQSEPSTPSTPQQRPRPRLRSIPGGKAETTNYRRRAGAVVTTLLLGGISAGLYLALFHYADSMTALAYATRAGHPLYALAPIAIALLFSAVHGAFTGHFWDLLGLRPKGR